MVQLHQAIEALDVPIFLVGLDQRVMVANRAAHLLLGYQDGALKGMPMQALLVPRRQGELRNFDELARGGAARRLNTMLRRDDGGSRHVAMMLSPVTDEHGRVAAITVRADVPGVMSASSSMPPASSSVAPPPSIPRPAPVPSRHLDSNVRAKPRRGSLPPVPATSEQRLNPVRAGAAPQEVVLAELEAKLERVHERFAWLEGRLSRTGEVPLSSPEDQGQALRIACELRVLIERSLELSGQARKSTQTANGTDK